MFDDNGYGEISVIVFVIAIGLFVCILFATGWGWAHFRLWKVQYTGKALEIEKKYKGQAILAEAKSARMARVEAARAEKEAAQLTADAIKIVGEMAKKYPEYRNQEFILSFGEALREGNINQVVYVPTEANIPIMEAGRIKR